MKTVGKNHSNLDTLFELLGMLEGYLNRIRVRDKHPLQTELDFIGISSTVAQIEGILREIKRSGTVS